MSRITTIPPELSGDSVEHFIWRDVDMEMPPEIEVEMDDGTKIMGSPTLLVSVVNSEGYRYVTTDMTIDGMWVVNQGDWNDGEPMVEAWMFTPDTYYNEERFKTLHPKNLDEPLVEAQVFTPENPHLKNLEVENIDAIS